MDCSQVLDRISEIERAVGVLDYVSIKRMLHETQDYILQSQKESIQANRLHESRIVSGNVADLWPLGKGLFRRH